MKHSMKVNEGLSPLKNLPRQVKKNKLRQSCSREQTKARILISNKKEFRKTHYKRLVSLWTDHDPECDRCDVETSAAITQTERDFNGEEEPPSSSSSSSSSLLPAGCQSQQMCGENRFCQVVKLDINLDRWPEIPIKTLLVLQDAGRRPFALLVTLKQLLFGIKSGGFYHEKTTTKKTQQIDLNPTNPSCLSLFLPDVLLSLL